MWRAPPASPILPAATGSTSEAAVQRLYQLPLEAMIDMGDFVGGMLKYLREHPVPRVTVAGGFGKITKMAQGAMDLHSGRSQVDFDWLAARLLALGGDDELAAQMRRANTAMEAEAMARAISLPLADDVARGAREKRALRCCAAPMWRLTSWWSTEAAR